MAKVNNLIKGYQEKLDFNIDDLSVMLIEVLSNNCTEKDCLEFLSTSSIRFDVGNDGSTYIKCLIESKENTDDIIQLEWRHEENIWKYVK